MIDDRRWRDDGFVMRGGKGGWRDWGGSFKGGGGRVVGTTGWNGQEWAFTRCKGNARPAKGVGGGRPERCYGKGKGTSWVGRGVNKVVGKGRVDEGMARKMGAYARLGRETGKEKARLNARKVAEIGEEEWCAFWDEADQWHAGLKRQDAGPRLEAALKDILRPEGECGSLLGGMPVSRGLSSAVALKWHNWYSNFMQGTDRFCTDIDKAKMVTMRGLVKDSRLNFEAGKMRLRTAVECVRGELAAVLSSGSDSGGE